MLPELASCKDDRLEAMCVFRFECLPEAFLQKEAASFVIRFLARLSDERLQLVRMQSIFTHVPHARTDEEELAANLLVY